MTPIMIRRLLLGALVLASAVYAQRKVDPRNTHQRIIVIVPYVGTGTAADPKRPQYAPLPLSTAQAAAQAAAQSRTGIIGYTHIASDDGRFAIVEYVARDQAAFQAILNDKSVLVFVKGKDKPADIEKALQSFKKGFSLSTFGAVMP